MKWSKLYPFLFLAFLVVQPYGIGQIRAGETTEPLNTIEKADTSKSWLLHLPGISGETGLDQGMIKGLRDGGYDGAVETYDWTGNNPGITALLAFKRNREQAQKIADLIVARSRANPTGRILITGHSAGAGLCAWALEDLPDDVKVDTILLLSPALSPGYDLSKALTHVRAKVYAFTSPNDVAILGIGTRLLGTVDGKNTVAAGRVGFTQPKDADPSQYQKLVAQPYDRGWMKYENIGDHVGMMTRPFARAVLAPLLLNALPKSETLTLTTASPVTPRPSATAERQTTATPTSAPSAPSAPSPHGKTSDTRPTGPFLTKHATN